MERLADRPRAVNKGTHQTSAVFSAVVGVLGSRGGWAWSSFLSKFETCFSSPKIPWGRHNKTAMRRTPMERTHKGAALVAKAEGSKLVKKSVIVQMPQTT